MEPPVPLGDVDVTAVLASLPVAIGIIDAQGAVRYANPRAESLYGWRVEDVLGRSALALGVAPTDTVAAADLLARVQLGESWQGRFPIVRGDAAQVPVWMSVVPLPATAGTEPELLVVAVDLSELGSAPDAGERAAVDRATDANLLLEGLLESVPFGMALLDRSLRFVRVNAAIAAFDGVDADLHVGRPLAELFHDLPADVASDVARVFAEGVTIPPRELRATALRDDDVPRDWVVSYYPVRRSGEVHWVGAVVVDVTEWRRSERERAQLLESERLARAAAERAVERLDRLQAVTARLGEAHDTAGVADVVVSHGTAGIGAAGGAVCTLDGDELVVVGVMGMDGSAVARFERIPLEAPVPSADAVRRGELVLLRSLEERDERYPALAGVPASNRSFAAAPMIVAGRAVGCLTFGWAEPRDFGEEDLDFLLALAQQAAQALERSRLYDAERRARAAAEEAGERMRFLAEASRVLASTLDYEVTLRELARIAVPEIADVCLVHLVVDDDTRLVVATHHDRDLVPVLTSVVDVPNRNREPRLLGRAVVTGESIVLDDVPDDLLVRVADSPSQLEALRSLDLRSAVIAPLRVQDRVIGLLTLAGDGSSGRRFGPEDLPFFEDLAGRAAVAVDNSRLHQARTDVARTLQQSLLPPHLPTIGGLELAQRYHSVGDVEVGGDFFDVFPAGDGRWGLVMGDVCGKGVAAASLTALARYTVRAAAIENDPSSVLRVLNRAILDADVGERFCTIVHARVEPRDDGLRVQLACGGHPLPLLLTAAGLVRPVGEPGTAIGLFEDVHLTEVELVLAPGDTFVLYTDGLTEARSPDGLFDPELLERVLATAAGRSAEGVAEVVDDAVLAYEGGRQRDDMALLVLRVPPLL